MFGFKNAVIVVVGCAAAALFWTGPARAGLINPTSTVDPYFDYVDSTSVPQAVASQVFKSAAPGPFSLAAPINPSTLYTSELYNLVSETGFLITDTAVTIYNNLGGDANNPKAPFCFSSGSSGSSCADPYDTFDFKFTNENITGVSIDSLSSADFLPAVFGSHLGLTLVSPNEFTVDVTGDDPNYLSELIIDVSFAAPSEIPLPPTLSLFAGGLGALGLLGWRRKRKAQVSL
jgi:hypothetical protein